MRLLRLFVPWLAILILAFANGALRELLLVPRLGHPWALLLSGILLCCCVLLVSWFAVGRLELNTTVQALGVGAFWLALTVLFEFTFGRLVQGKPWSELLDAYSFARGNLWPVVLLLILLGPAAIQRIRADGPSE